MAPDLLYLRDLAEVEPPKASGWALDKVLDGDSECDEFLDNNPFGWTDNWTLSYADGVNTAEGRNQGEGLDARIGFE